MAKGIEELPIQTGGWGASVEDDRQSTVILGWESLEVRELAAIMLRKLVNNALLFNVDIQEHRRGQPVDWRGDRGVEETRGS